MLENTLITITKLCPTCGQIKGRVEFSKDKKSKDGLLYCCKTCRETYRKSWRNLNRTKDNAVSREWQRRNKEKLKLIRLKWKLKHKFKLPLDAYQKMLEAQDGKCAICKTTVPGRGNKLFSIDHCHSSCLVRGLLCNNCNSMIGYAKDNSDTLEAGALYLRNRKET